MDYSLQEPDRAQKLLMFFKDADGLDRVRINDLNPAMLRLCVSKEIVAVAEELYFHWDNIREFVKRRCLRHHYFMRIR
jgi:hypothetical protein